MLNKLFQSALLILALLSASCARSVVEMTPAQKNNYTKLTSNAAMIRFLERADSLHPKLRLEKVSLNDSLWLPVVYFEDSLERPGRKISIMLIAQQHGNEPSGMEGMLLLLRDIALGKHNHWLDHARILMIPQCNPYGGDHHLRRNAQGIDLNRDHLTLNAAETRIIQRLFATFDPHFTADFHEYYPYSKSWEDFGYLRNFDIQLGGPTNLNTSDEIRHTFANRLLPFVQKQLNAKGYSFFEYTLGHLPSGERMRRSTTDIDDGRQSFAITGTFSVIVEGMNGRDSLHNLQRRATSQQLTAVSLLAWAVQNRDEVINLVDKARNKVISLPVPIAVRQEHVPDGVPLNYPLRSLKTGLDTMFVVENYHNKVVSNQDVMPPRGYLIPKENSLLMQWLLRNDFLHTADTIPDGMLVGYHIRGFEACEEEETALRRAIVEKVSFRDLDPNDYIYIPLNQKYNLRLMLALEPQSMYGLIHYKGYETLSEGPYWPVLRLE